ncbi:hypothetical protein MRX96_017048 [Rhipicephalus microplus]
MRQVVGNTTGLDSRLVWELFLQRLPAVLRIGIMAFGEMDVHKITELADRLMDITPQAVATVPTEASPSPAMLQIPAEISRLTDTITALCQCLG